MPPVDTFESFCAELNGSEDIRREMDIEGAGSVGSIVTDIMEILAAILPMLPCGNMSQGYNLTPDQAKALQERLKPPGTLAWIFKNSAYHAYQRNLESMVNEAMKTDAGRKLKAAKVRSILRSAALKSSRQTPYNFAATVDSARSRFPNP